MTLSDAKDWTAILVGAVAVITLAKALLEYINQAKLKRGELFHAMRVRFKDQEPYKSVWAAIERFEPLDTIPVWDRRTFLGLFEEVWLLVNSRLMKPLVAYYYFGPYALRASDAPGLWAGMDTTGSDWLAFNAFVAEMKRVAQTLPHSAETFKREFRL
jgi:hypothetical protein